MVALEEKSGDYQNLAIHPMVAKIFQSGQNSLTGHVTDIVLSLEWLKNSLPVPIKFTN